MGFAVTNTGKAKNILKRKKLDQQIANGDRANINISLKETAKEILLNGKCDYFEVLDEAGRILKASMFTRSTAHKVYDFSSIQSESSLKLQKFYKDIFNNSPQDLFINRGNLGIKLDKKTERKVNALGIGMGKALDRIQGLIKKNKEMGDFIKQQLQDDRVTMDTLNKLDGLLPNNVAFVEKNYAKAGKDLTNKQLKCGLESLAVGGFVGSALAALAGVSFTVMGLMPSTGGGFFGPGIFLCLAPVASGVGFAAGLAIPAAVAIAFFLGALIVYCNKEKLGTIVLKKIAIKINDEFKNALKYLNEAAQLVRKNSEMQGAKKNEKEVEPTEAQENILADFIKGQQALWKPYTTAEGRKYTNTKDSSETGTHRSILLKVKNAKTYAIGKMKVGIAKTWAEMKCH